MDITGLFGLLGMSSIGMTMFILGLLSKRLGAITHTPPFYKGLYVSATLVAVSVLIRLTNLLHSTDSTTLHDDPVWVLLYIGLPVVAVTLAVIVAWRYWSWLLAERA